MSADLDLGNALYVEKKGSIQEFNIEYAELEEEEESTTRKNTDPLARRHSFDNVGVTVEEKKSPMHMAIYNMLAGCGLVGLPLTFKQSGIIPGIFTMFVVASFSVYTFRLLIKNGRKVNVLNYEDLCHKCWGVFGYYNLIITMLLTDIGQCLTYAIILADSAQSVCDKLFGWSSFRARQLLLTAAFVFFLFPFSLGKDFRFIEKISACAIFAITFMVGVVTFEYFHTYQDDAAHVDLFSSNVSDLVKSFGAIAFAFSQQDQTFLVYKTLENPTTNRFTILATWAMAIQFVLCVTVGLFGYLSFGYAVSDDILKALGDGPLILGVRVLYTFTMVFIFPTAFYVVRHIIYSTFYYEKGDTFEKASFRKRLFFTVTPLTSFLLLSLWITDLGMVMALTGVVAVVNLTFILPVCIHLKLTQYSVLPWKVKRGQRCAAIIDTWPSVGILVFGAISVVIGVMAVFIS